MKTTPRNPAVAGRFYPATPGRLQEELVRLFKQARKKECNNVRAVISPHAGYVFSGGVAASAFNQVDPQKKIQEDLCDRILTSCTPAGCRRLHQR